MFKLPIDKSGGIRIVTPLKSVEILLVEDDPADIELTSEALKDSKMRVNLTVVDDGVKAMQFLKQEAPYIDAFRPDLVILDLNLPRKNGREVLQEIKKDENLRSIPVCILTTSNDALDIKKCYEWGANCWITKPIGLKEFSRIVRSIQDFWFTVVKLP
jgi:chemotaxis family two-component system response regulator Rcp1